MNYRTISSLIGKQGFSLVAKESAKSGFYWRSSDGKFGGPVSEGVAQEYLSTPDSMKGQAAKNWQIQENQYLVDDFEHPGTQKTSVAFMLVRKAAEVEAVATFEEFD